MRLAFAALALLVLAACGRAPETLQPGLWDGAIFVEGEAVPFQFRLGQDATGPSAVFFDGDREINPSSSGSYRDGRLKLDFATYAAVLDAKWQQGAFKGTYSTARWSFPVEVKPHRAETAKPQPGPPIEGDWIVEAGGSKHETGWRLTIRQKEARAYATILRIDGDTGTLSGTYRDGAWRLSHFAGERPVRADIAPQGDGTLKVSLVDDDFGKHELVARAPEAAARAGVAPADPSRFTDVKDRSEPFRFSGKELSTGKRVDQDDPRFRGKVVLVNLSGSWCPNCHDEAPFLVELDAKYRDRGLVVVSLDFEHADQIGDPWRLRAFVKKYGLTYPVLLVGEPKDVQQKLPQATNLGAFPTSFFLGRDGKVRSVHVGFTSAGNAAHDAALKAEITREIEALLAESQS
jgi:thiol-disulfide isomerase/thioredoxin